MIPSVKQMAAFFVFIVAATAPFLARSGQSTTFFGDLTCAKYVEAVNENVNHPYQNYIGGFLTGVNYIRSRTTPTDFSSYRVWVKGYCQPNPFDTFLQALARLDFSLGEGEHIVKGAPTQKKNAKK